ncbi:MAG: transposase [Microcystis sp. M_OC_Ca_00000000_S217Cul]|nr:MAG: transposase [Microcystis sp. M_OC_Ca_00000000_S217Cul]TRT91642.1 MAG: transposase [Microcystis sp. M_OC_Ca_00000000_C217Col]
MPRLRLPPLSRGARGDRTGHFWEKRYFCDGFPPSDRERALNTLRYIHGNPKAAKMRSTFFYDFSNYGSYERLTDDGLTQWHPAFLKLGDSLEECARKYKGFCQKYKPKEKNTAIRCHWGSKLLARVHLPEPKSSDTRESRKRGTEKRNNLCFPAPSLPASSPCQVSETPELTRIVRQFLEANRAPWQGEKDF